MTPNPSNTNQPTKEGVKSIFVVTTALAAILCTGCGTILTLTYPEVGTMRTQSGELVEVRQDLIGRKYYFENGAKVYVNKTRGQDTDGRPTVWQDR